MGQMTDDGWGYALGSRSAKKHYFIDGTSCCKRHVIGATYIFKTPNLGCNVCKDCLARFKKEEKGRENE